MSPVETRTAPSPADDPGRTATHSRDANDPVAGTVVAGRYKLLQQIGQGGMGTVWMALQTEPVSRRVALKLIRSEYGRSKQILSRFEAERQAIALMDHPNIARLLDAGVRDDAGGAPFFVLELVRGVPLTEYCDKHRLSVPDRLALFVPICAAVQHAHQKGILHRDLKPSNILVESHDGKPVPKVIDFGLAKATGGLQLTERTLFTGFGAVIGTPLYMAPEQATFNAIDVDTRADVYALGVILYELLTGSTPLTRESVRKAAIDEVFKRIREQDAPTPSSRLASGEGTATVAANRQTDPAQLGRFVRGELDWIVMKSLRKEREGRYASATDFARDLERFLRHEPVYAGPPGAAYKLRKFVRRNRGPVVAASLLGLSLIAGIVGTALGLVEANRQAENARNEATAKDRALREEERQRALAERAEADTLADYRATTDDALEHLLGSKAELGPRERAFLERMLARWQAFAARVGDDERSLATRAEGDHRVGVLWGKLGRQDECLLRFESARGHYDRLVAAYPAVAKYRHGRAVNLVDLGISLLGRGDGDAAESLFREAIAAMESLSSGAPGDRSDLAGAHHILAIRRRDAGDLAGAEAALRAGLRIRERLVADFPDPPSYRGELASSYSGLAGILDANGKPDEAGESYRRALALRRSVRVQTATDREPRHHEALSLVLLGRHLSSRGRRDEAEGLFREAIGTYERLLIDYPAVSYLSVGAAQAYVGLGNHLRVGDSPEGAITWFDRAIDGIRPYRDANANNVTARSADRDAHEGRALTARRLGRHADAIRDFDRALDLAAEAERPRLRAARARSYLESGRISDAVNDVAAVSDRPGWTGDDLYDFARVYVAASTAVELHRAERADRAVALLREAGKAGFRDAGRVRADAAFGPLLAREDMKSLLASWVNPDAKP